MNLIVMTTLLDVIVHELQVVDHLCLINKLVEKGFDEEQAELALHSHENNDEKVSLLS